MTDLMVVLGISLLLVFVYMSSDTTSLFYNQECRKDLKTETDRKKPQFRYGLPWGTHRG